MKISSRSRKTRARNPSHFGSKIQSPLVGNSPIRLASIGKTGGFTGRFTRQSYTEGANGGDLAPPQNRHIDRCSLRKRGFLHLYTNARRRTRAFGRASCSVCARQ